MGPKHAIKCASQRNKETADINQLIDQVRADDNGNSEPNQDANNRVNATVEEEKKNEQQPRIAQDNDNLAETRQVQMRA